jgi:hypothetical protein
MTEELKSCPKCKSIQLTWERWLLEKGGEKYEALYRPYCLDCAYASDYWTADVAEAVRYWNTRPIEDELRAEIAALQARLADLENGRPMETAPRDGTEILITSEGRWISAYTWFASFWSNLSGDYDIEDNEALRWWPLPGSVS